MSRLQCCSLAPPNFPFFSSLPPSSVHICSPSPCPFLPLHGGCSPPPIYCRPLCSLLCSPLLCSPFTYLCLPFSCLWPCAPLYLPLALCLHFTSAIPSPLPSHLLFSPLFVSQFC